MDNAKDAVGSNIEVDPVSIVSQTFPARPSSIPDIRDFVRRSLDSSPLTEEDNRDVGETVSQALLEAAGPAGAINVSFRVFPDHVEVEVLCSGAPADGDPGQDQAPASFAEWLSGVLRREGMTMESAAEQLGVSAKTVRRWVGGSTEPRLRDLRRIHELFGEAPLS